MPSRSASTLHRRERLVVARGAVAHAADRRQQRVLGSDARVVEARRHRVRLLDLAVVVLQQHANRCRAAPPGVP